MLKINKNNLAFDPSPYLQQHKNNPVNWQIWSKEAFEIAKKKKMPILLSIGYSSCHWCHVMAHESFEDEETAKVMNEYFINIKVDREERPDIDFVYQNSYQIFNQSGGGWPLTMFLDENGVPFMAGTYFPKEDSNGLPSFKSVLKKIHSVYQEQREKILDQKELIVKSLELKKNAVLNQDLEIIADSILKNLDSQNGGFVGAPKFPTFYIFDTLLYFFNTTKKEKYIKPIHLFLKKICSQGIYDQVEGGISRYTVDDKWLIPHFEKMLYDNAQFVSLLSNYCKSFQDEYLKKKICQTIDFINNNFLVKNDDLLGSAYDADSDGIEGKYYIFKYEELKNIKDIEKYFDIKAEGNWEGKIILREIKSPSQDCLEELLKIRKKRNKPFFDKKVQLDLNCLWISALINAHQILPEKDYLKKAENFYEKIKEKFTFSSPYHSNDKKIVFLEDYALLINALIDLFENTLNIKYKIEAKNLCDKVVEYFYIGNKDIFQKNSVESNDLFIEPVDISDHTLPNGNSIMLRNFARLGLKESGEKLSNSLNGYLNIYKTFMFSSLKSIDLFKKISIGKKCNEQGCEI